MGQLRLGPDNVLSPRIARFLKAEANCNVEAEANSLSRAEAQPHTNNPLRRAEEPTAALRLAPRAQAVAASGGQQLANQTPSIPLTFSSGIRALVAVVIVVALLLNLTLGAIFWLGVMSAPWSRPVTLPPNERPLPAARSAIPPAVLSAPATLELTGGKDVTFPIALDGTDGVPARSIIAIRGLPQGSKLSSGRLNDETEWNLKTDEIGDLHLVLPNTASGEANLIIRLVAPDGAIITDTATVLKMTADPKALAKAQILDEPAQALGATGAEEEANLDAATVAPEDPLLIPPRRPAPTANDDVHANSITPLAFVNLRIGPSASARVISVVAKGAKLRVIGRKGRWVHVTNPATSERGWIYAGHVRTVR